MPILNSKSPVLLILMMLFLSGSDRQSLEDELKRTGSNTAILLPYHGVHGFPLWSDEDNLITARLNDFWFVIDLTEITLLDSVWRDDDQPVAVITQDYPFSRITDSAGFDAVLKGENSITLENKTSFSLIKENGQTVFKVSKDESEKVIWKTGKETCSHLSASPDQSLIGFTCSVNGLIVVQTTAFD